MAASDRADDGHAGSHADGHEDSHADGGEAQREECFALLARLLGLLGGQAVLPRSFHPPQENPAGVPRSEKQTSLVGPYSSLMPRDLW